MRTLGGWLLLILLVECAVFVVGYAVRSRGQWRKHPMGVHLMAFMAGFGLIVTLVAVHRWVVPLPAWVFTGVWALLVALVGWRDVLLFREPPLVIWADKEPDPTIEKRSP